MIVLDTNVVSAMMRRDADHRVRDWLDRRPLESLWVTSMTIFEVRFGISILAEGRRRDQLDEDFARTIAEDLQNRILDFDAAAASAAICADRKRRGRPIDMRDTLIAGIAASRRADIATRNIKHFDDLDIAAVDPWTAR